MKPWSMTAIFGVILIIGAIVLSASKPANVTDGVPVLSDAWREGLVTQLQNAPSDAERERILNANNKPLTVQLALFLKSQGYDCPITSLRYKYGSGTARNVPRGDNSFHTGIFENQPYAVVKGSCYKFKDPKTGIESDSLSVFIRCFNGTFSLTDPNAIDLGTGNMEFEIAPGEGINNHVPDFVKSIDLADACHVPLYEIRNGVKKEITADQARALKDSLPWIRVVSDVKPGDKFNLATMTKTPAKN